MSKVRFFTAALFVVLLAMCCGSHRATSRRTEAQEAYEAGVALYRQGSMEEAIAEIKRALRLDPDNAPAHNLLGEIYRIRGDISARYLSAQEIQRAVRLDPENPAYHYNLGLTYLARNFRFNAIREFNRTTQLDPQFQDAHLQLGILYKWLGIEYGNKEYLNQALSSLRRARQLGPDDDETAFHLGMILAELGESREVLAELKGIERYRADIHLLMAMAYHQLDEYDSARVEYQSAIQLMGPLERRGFEDIGFLLSPEQMADYERFPGRDEYIRQFWMMHDPTPTTEINERLLEHYRRVAFSNLHFGLPKEGVPGWKTKRGEIYIRYGEPTNKVRIMGDIGPICRDWIMGNTGSVGLSPPQWVWSYQDISTPFTLTFEDASLNGNFDFPAPRKGWTDSDYRESSARLARSLSNTLPQLYLHDYGGGLKYARRVFQFRGEEGQTAIELFWGVPPPELLFRRAGSLSRSDVEKRATIFNRSWYEVARVVDGRQFTVEPTQTTNQNFLLMSKAALQAPPGEYILAMSLQDLNSDKMGIFKDSITVRDFGNGKLALSDVILATSIEPTTEADDFFRSGFRVIPRLSAEYQHAQILHLYYEIYGLSKDSRNLTRYRTEYIIARRPSQRGMFSGLLRAVASLVGAGSRWKSISSVFDAWGEQEIEIGNLSIDMGDALPGDYDLILKVRDMNSGEDVEQRVSFRMKGS